MDLGHFRAGFELEKALFILRCDDYIVGRGPLSSSERAANDVAAETSRGLRNLGHSTSYVRGAETPIFKSG
jgi:hypothetical protein